MMHSELDTLSYVVHFPPHFLQSGSFFDVLSRFAGRSQVHWYNRCRPFKSTYRARADRPSSEAVQAHVEKNGAS